MSLLCVFLCQVYRVLLSKYIGIIDLVRVGQYWKKPLWYCTAYHALGLFVFQSCIWKSISTYCAWTVGATKVVVGAELLLKQVKAYRIRGEQGGKTRANFDRCTTYSSCSRTVQCSTQPSLVLKSAGYYYLHQTRLCTEGKAEKLDFVQNPLLGFFWIFFRIPVDFSKLLVAP